MATGRFGRLVARALTTFGLAMAIAAPARGAGVVDPRLRFHLLHTPHFVIYFHDGEEALARRLAGVVEGVRTEVGTALRTEPPPQTHVILADQSEIANGWATPLPRDTVFLNAAAPSGADLIGRTDDWLRLVFTHEFTHIVHLDRSGAWAWLARGIFGRTAIAFPNLWLPQWQIEGLATWEESALTGEGRQAAGDFRAIERVAAAEGRALTIDRASGGLVGWPDGHAAYAAGLGFHEYLVGRFGEASLGALARATSRRLPFFGTTAYRSVYGESLGTLWRDYRQALMVQSVAAVPADLQPSRVTRHGNIVTGPRFAPPACESCPAEIIYSLRTPDAFPSLRSVAPDGSADRALTTRYLGATTGVSASAIVFDQQELRRNVGLYSDLYWLDRRTGTVRVLGRETRLQDPDLSPDGRSIAAVREHGGQRDLVVASVSGNADTGTRTLDGDIKVVAAWPDAQFSTPRWSPDGLMIVAERRQVGSLPDVVVIDAVTGGIRLVLADAHARIVTPTWRPDGRAIVAAADFDAGPFDIYEFALVPGGGARRLTRTAGAFWPDVSPDARMMVFAGYGVDGYDVYSVPYERPDTEAPRALAAVPESVPAATTGQGAPARSYSPLATLRPTSWFPLLEADADQTRFGASIGGADILTHHAYGLNLTWLVDGPAVARPVDSAQPDWAASYAYTRWRPSLFASASRETLFRTLRDRAASNDTPVAVSEREFQAGIFLPLLRTRRNAQALVSLVRTDVRYRLPGRDRDTRLVSSRLALAHDTTNRFGNSISRERGVNIGSTLELARRALVAQADATTATIDARVYLPGVTRHGVVALRAAGGTSRGADDARQAFTLGSTAASPSVIDFSSGALGLMRGETAPARTGNRIVVGNLEYRIPLARIERGAGTWPLLVRTVHASVFADVGQLRAAGASTAPWTRAFGGEMSVDVVAGYALPFAASIGAAWGREGGQRGGTTLYARVGRAF